MAAGSNQPTALTPYLKLKPKARRFIDAYLTDAAFNSTEAARMAGYGSPQTLGPRLARKYSQLIDTQAELLKQSALVSPQRVVEGLSEIALRTTARDGDRIKAYEVLARIHGMLSDKLQVDVDSSSLRRELAAMSAARAGEGRALAPGAQASLGAGQIGPPALSEPLDAELVERPDNIGKS